MTNEQMFRTLIKTVETLETENRRLRRIVIAITVALSALFVMGQSRQNRTIEAEKLIIRDSQGRARITIGTGMGIDMHKDDPAIWLSDDKGHDRVILLTDGLYFADQHSKPLKSYLAKDLLEAR